MAPLPRSSLRVAGASYLQQLEQACKAAGRAVPANLRDAPRLYQGASVFLGAHDDFAYGQWGIDYEAGIAAITDDVAMGATPDQAHLNIKLLMLINDITLRLWRRRAGRRLRLSQAKPAMATRPSPSRPTSWVTPGAAARCITPCAAA
jgi:fumarylacetoacetate (FAA) hydrolase